MSTNYSFNSSDPTLHLPHMYCFGSRPGIFIFTAFALNNILLLPLYILVLYVGYQQWRKQRSVSAAATTSHADIFTYHMVVLELNTVLGCCFYCCGAFTDSLSVVWVGMGMFSISSTGQTLFHLLTCVDRYLAVVHPITYMGLKQWSGVTIRNISIGCVWLLCVGSVCLTVVASKSVNIYISSVLYVFSLIVISFCSFSVLWVLIRPWPGEVGGDRERVDQTKRRAFHTMTAILGALWLRFLGLQVSNAFFSSVLPDTRCVVGSVVLWLSLPSSLVLPLLFLHRAGKLPECKPSGQGFD